MTAERPLCPFFVALFFALLAACGESPRDIAEREKKERNEKQQESRNFQKRIFEELKAKHNADSQWDQNDTIFSFQLQEKLIRTDRQPLIGVAGLWDVDKVGEFYRVHLISEFGKYVNQNLELVIDCEKSRLNELSKPGYMERRFRWALPQFIFVTRIRSLRKSEHIEVSVNTENPTIDIRPSYIAEGECIDLKSTAESESKPEAN